MGPSGATEMLLYTLYQQAFRYFDVGAAAALAVVFLLLVGVLSILQVRLFDREARMDEVRLEGASRLRQALSVSCSRSPPG